MTNPKNYSVFLSYSHRDERYRDELVKHLSILQRQGFITRWYDRKIDAGSEWAREIDINLEQADIILLLVSSDYLASDYCFDIEMMRALELHESGDAIVIPIILRAVDWENAPFAHLQALPRDGKPISSFEYQDEAWVEISRSIRNAINEAEVRRIRNGDIEPVTEKKPLELYRLYQVFKESGVPTVTFVEPENFDLLKLDLEKPGRGLVIEGPSGIGKTTAISHLDKNFSNEIKLFSARNNNDVKKLITLEEWHDGIVVIDDFHRLDENLRENIGDYLKFLADQEIINKKLVVIGIPSTGRKLIQLAFDLANRITLIKFGRVSDKSILQMIEKGERALNITFDRKFEIVNAANGSLNIAQMLCYQTAVQLRITETQLRKKAIECDLESAVENVKKTVSLKFDDVVRRFALLGGPRDRTCIELLQELARSQDGYLSLEQIKDSKPSLKKGIISLIDTGAIEELYLQYPELENHLYYDKSTPACIVSEPVRQK